MTRKRSFFVSSILIFQILIIRYPACSQKIIPDKSFYQKGFVLSNSGASGETTRKAIPDQEGGYYTAVNFRTTDSKVQGRLIHQLPDGSVDPAFNNGKGFFTISEFKDNYLYDFVVSEGSLILLYSHNQIVAESYAAFCRLKKDGTLDVKFRDNGIQYIMPEKEARGTAIVTDKEGNIYISAIYRYNSINWQVILMKFLPDGNYDSNFGTAGVSYIPVGASEEVVYALRLDSKGRIILGGSTDEAAVLPAERNYMIVRLNQNGSLDHTFNKTGKMLFSWKQPGAGDYITSLTIREDNSILANVNIRQDTDGKTSMSLAQISSSGILEKIFEINSTGMINRIFTDTTGKIWAAGYQRPEPSVFIPVIMRFNSDGTPDISFDEDGIYTADFLKGGQISDIYLENNKIIITGTADTETALGIPFIARLTAEPGKPTPFLALSDISVQCGAREILIPIQTDSKGKKFFNVTGGPAAIVKDSLLNITGRGRISIKYHQNADSLFSEADTTFEIQSHCDIEVYEYISPGHDGMNDFFTVKNIEYFPDNEVTVLSQWQEVIFRKSGYTNNWAATDLQEGSYYYVVKTRNPEAIYKGTLMVNRK